MHVARRTKSKLSQKAGTFVSKSVAAERNGHESSLREHSRAGDGTKPRHVKVRRLCCKTVDEIFFMAVGGKDSN